MGIELVKKRPGEAPGPLGVGSVQAAWGHLAAAVSEGVVIAAAPGTTRDSARAGLARLGAGIPNTGRADQMAERLLRAFSGDGHRVTIPVGLAGTSFQLEVWEALMSVPIGSTVTYAELAWKIGRPRAVRAVASACAANRIGIVVPCHRVVRADGSSGGYRWGEGLKRRIIEAERSTGVAGRQVGGASVIFRAA